MAIPDELFRVWTECEVQDGFGLETYYTWASVWYVLCTDPLANPTDVAAPFAAMWNSAATNNIICQSNVVTKYGGRNVNAGGPDAEIVTGNFPIAPSLDIMPPQVSALVLGRSLHLRSQTRKWVGAARWAWADPNTGRLDVTDNVLVNFLKSTLQQKINGGLVIQPVVFDVPTSTVREIQEIVVMEGFRTQRRRSLAETAEI